MHGVADNLKRRVIFNYYKQRADIICLQETHSEPKDEVFWNSEFGGHGVYSDTSTKQAGVCILMKKTVPYCIVKHMADGEGRFVICECESCDDPTKRFCLASIYAPNRDCPQFFINLFKQLTNFAPDKLIVGNYNLVMNPNLDRRSSTFNHH